LMRESIRSWPKGIYTFVDYMDSDGMGGPPVKIQVALQVEGDTLIADFSGTDSQVPGAINCTFSFTAAVVAMCARQMIREDVPNTAGLFRPLKIVAPSGSLLNCVMPAASSMRGITGFRAADCVLGAFAKMLPDRVIAAGEGGNSLIILGGRENTATSGGPYVFYELMSGTWGAMADHDGNDGLCNPANVASNIPVEQAECEYPVRIESYGFARDSGGAGRARGGVAVEREWLLLTGTAHLAIRSDRRDHLPYGLAGGCSGKGSTSILLHPNGESEVLATMISTSMKAGDRLYHRQAGGGGFGDPFLRDPEAVAWDVKNDKVSLAAAKEEYGVVLDQQTLTAQIEATEELRGRQRAAERNL
jgi:N-methylhydantoinase B/oxoprolinase/acetone carboxylase alpha subunit